MRFGTGLRRAWRISEPRNGIHLSCCSSLTAAGLLLAARAFWPPAARGPLGKLRNLAKCSRCLRIVAFLKEKDRKAEIPSDGIKISGNLHHCIANKHERANLAPSILHACMSNQATFADRKSVPFTV